MLISLNIKPLEIAFHIKLATYSDLTIVSGTTTQLLRLFQKVRYTYPYGYNLHLRNKVTAMSQVFPAFYDSQGLMGLTPSNEFDVC